MNEKDKALAERWIREPFGPSPVRLNKDPDEYQERWRQRVIERIAGELPAIRKEAREAAFSEAESDGSRSLFPQGDWQHVQIKAGNPRVVAIQFETAQQATEFINTFAAATSSTTPAESASVANLEAWTTISGWLREHPEATAAECLAELIRRIKFESAPAERTREVFDAGFSAERTEVEGEQGVRSRLESIAEPWICAEEKPCEEAVPVHWNEMITALAAAEQRSK